MVAPDRKRSSCSTRLTALPLPTVVVATPLQLPKKRCCGCHALSREGWAATPRQPVLTAELQQQLGALHDLSNWESGLTWIGLEGFSHAKHGPPKS